MQLLSRLFLATLLTTTFSVHANEGWFCQTAPDNESWECQQDAALVRDPQPTRMPPPKQIASPASLASTPAAPTTPPQPDPSPLPPMEAATPQHSTAQDEDTALPLHLALAYSPENATSFMDLPPQFWAVQVMALSSAEAVEYYVSQQGLKRMSAAVVETQGQLMYALILGIYDSREKANRVAAALPPPFEAVEPYVRSVASLQAAIQRGEALADGAVDP